MKYFILISLFSAFFLINCTEAFTGKENKKVKTGAELTSEYLNLLENKSIAVVANHTSLINNTHLVDSLLELGINIKKIFSPEHGFRGKADAGELVDDYTDKKTGLPVVSLYGRNKKPDLKDLKDVDIVIFDLQDVGVRFYTYISTMHYVMEACAEAKVEMLIFDRPNPNGFYVDGPVLDTTYRSFVGMHPVPVVHGMTIAEYARMINGEGWLKNNLKCKLSYIPCKNYTHDCLYELPVNPSPNLQNMLSVYLYPSLGLLEGTSMSVGRGTSYPFQVFGSPDFKSLEFEFIPKSIKGVSNYPKYLGEKCFGIDLRKINIDSLILLRKINLEWLIYGYHNQGNKDEYFNNFFYNLSGTKCLKESIIKGESKDIVRKRWNEELEEFKKIRKKYLIYKDFNQP